jgi:hypothetical protein
MAQRCSTLLHYLYLCLDHIVNILRVPQDRLLRCVFFCSLFQVIMVRWQELGFFLAFMSSDSLNLKMLVHRFPVPVPQLWLLCRVPKKGTTFHRGSTNVVLIISHIEG